MIHRRGNEPFLVKAFVIALTSTFIAPTSVRAEEPSMFGGVPQFQKAIPIDKAMRVEKQADGSTIISGKLHGGGGIEADIIVPEIKYNVRIDGPSGKDENGHPLSMTERFDREMAHALVFKGLQERGYVYETHRKKVEEAGVKTQLDEWKEKTEETKKYIAEHGPITTKDFIVPGSTPEQSALLNDPEVGVRKENGKLVYYLNGERLNLTAPKTPKLQAKSEPATKVITELSVSRKTPEVEKKIHKIQRTPPTEKYMPAADEDLRRSPTDLTNAHIGEGDALKAVNDMFQDLGKQTVDSPFESIKSDKCSKNDDCFGSKKALNNQSSVRQLDIFITRILGIREANAADMRKDEKNVWDSKISENSHQFSEFSDLIDGIKESHNRIVSSVESNEADDQQDFVQSIRANGENFDPTAFAAEVVNRTQKSLTEEQFNDDLQMIVGLLSEKDHPSNVFDALSDILESNPEIYQELPDADKRLQALRGDVFEIAPPNPLGESTYIFISYSLSECVLKEIIERQKDRADVTLVMRGVPDGMNIPDGVLKIQKLASETSHGASVIIDPALFREYGITKVPSVVRVGRNFEGKQITFDPNALDKPGRKFPAMIASVEGLHNDQWLLEQIENGQEGHLGVQGDVHEIAEPDLIEEMKRRIAMIDWQKKKEEAAKRFWTNQKFKVFPTAESNRVREVDPSFIVKEDLKDLAGRFIRRKGDRINPLAIRPFTQTMLIFNPVSEAELKRVAKFKKAFKKTGRGNLVLIATQMDKGQGWDGYREITDKLDAHVFMMTPEIEHQWRIEQTPSVVTADNEKHIFIVRELGSEYEQE